jgi:hypothetical protein
MATDRLPLRGAPVPQVPFQMDVAGKAFDLLLLHELSPLSKPLLYSVTHDGPPPPPSAGAASGCRDSADGTWYWMRRSSKATAKSRSAARCPGRS